MSSKRPGSRHYKRLDRKRWQHLRRLVLDAANWRCAKCGAFANECDHIQPLQHGGDPYDEANLQCLCRACHVAKTRKENTRPDAARDAWRALVAELR